MVGDIEHDVGYIAFLLEEARAHTPVPESLTRLANSLTTLQQK
jgi:hypothetical protein